MLRITLLLAALLATPALAQGLATKTVAESRAGLGVYSDGCELGLASADLDVGGVRARLYNTGGLFWRGGPPTYEVPQGSGINAMFAAGIWLGGTVDGELRFAGADYSNWEWWPGPLDVNGNPPADCAPFDRIYLVTQQPDGSLTGDVADWPADLGAPFEDADGDGTYEPEAGETPTVYGHQTAFWVMNDRGNAHNWSAAEPLGLTARVTAFTFNSDDPALGFSTFYRYEFENPNAYTIENARLAFWSDPDLGNFNDDYVGSDPERGMGFVYNGDENDAGVYGYGAQPPALGIDLLNGGEGMLYYNECTPSSCSFLTGETAYGYLNFTWRDGNPLTIGSNGYNPGTNTKLTTWTWPGAPEQLAYWSELDTDGMGSFNQPADRRFLNVASPFKLGPGETYTVDLALVWGRGVSFLDSVTRIRAHSDQVQAAYDAGTLFAPGGKQTGPPDGSAPPLPAPTLDTPTLTFPKDGIEISDLSDDELVELDDQFVGGSCPGGPLEECARVPLQWEAVPGATLYEVQVVHNPADFDDTPGSIAPTSSLLAPAYADNERDDVYWRVRARTSNELGVYSEISQYRTRYAFVPSILGQGRGIVEIAYDGTATCDANPTRTGCAEYDGATVLHTPSTDRDFYVTARDGIISRMLSYRGAITSPFDYELRFTDACATDDCWAVYTLFDGFRETGQAVRVPFELWQTGIGTPDDPSDDIRMIPVLRAGSIERDSQGNPIPGPYGPDWNYSLYANGWFGGGVVDGGADPDAEVSDQVFWMMPDRPDGYARFAQDAEAAGAGNLITTTDTQIDPNPSSDTGEACRNQGFYIDFCHRNDETELSAGIEGFMAPIGLMEIADEAGNDTPPPPGTVVRFVTAKPEPVSAEGDGPQPQALTLDAYPNPVRGIATLAYALPASGRATLTVYDVLGCRVAVLADEVQAAGTHRATLATTRLASGVYVAVIATEVGQQTRRFTVLR
ncbi:MAG: T9SS type A sorting domain-containing protein [Bacteroidota bacterium]